LTPASGRRRAVSLLHGLALSVCLGGPIVFAAAMAPAARRAASAGQAGAIVGEALTNLSVLLQGAFAVLFATTLSQTRESRRRRIVIVARRAPVLGFFCAMVTASLVVPALEKLRPALADPGVRARFDRLHRSSVTLLALELACALLVLWISTEWSVPPEPAVPVPPKLP
jgi:hypothetical protein